MRQIIGFFRQSVKENADEIIERTRKAQFYLSGAGAILYLLYGFHLFLVDGMEWNNFFAIMIGCVAGIHCLLLRLELIPRKHILFVGNCFLVLFLICLSIARTLGGGYELLVVYTIVATVVLSVNPFSYSLCMLFGSIFDRVLQGICFHFDYYEFGTIFLEEGFLLAIVIALNFYISYLQHCVFQEMKLLKMDSRTDAMTGLYNRRYLEQYFLLHEQENTLSALIHIDLDNFKTLNDTLGHQAGDAMLIQISDLLRAHFRRTDCVARVGGDEFVVYMPHLAAEENATERVQRFLAELPLFAEGEGTSVAISASIGVAFSQKSAPSAYAQLYDLADTAMYQAKKTGKGKAVYLYEKET